MRNILKLRNSLRVLIVYILMEPFVSLVPCVALVTVIEFTREFRVNLGWHHLGNCLLIDLLQTIQGKKEESIVLNM